MLEEKVRKRKKSKEKLTQKMKGRRPRRESCVSERQEEAEARQGYRLGELERRFGFKPNG
jgi:hypothetical protein